MTSPPGWHGDPYRRFTYRFWDGEHWSEHVSSGGLVETDVWPVGHAEVPVVATESPRTDQTDSRLIVMTKAANALVEGGAVKLSAVSEKGLEGAGVEGQSISWVLEKFREHYGGLWVGGRVTLSTESIAFRPNVANRIAQVGTSDIVIPLTKISRVEVLSGAITKIVALHLEGKVVKVRCFGASALAAEIDRVRGA